MTGDAEVLRICGISQFDPPEFYWWLVNPAALLSATFVGGLLDHDEMAWTVSDGGNRRNLWTLGSASPSYPNCTYPNSKTILEFLKREGKTRQG